MPDSSSSSLRSVKIGSDERTGWSSERPRREGEPERPRRPVDVSARCRVLSPTDRLRYAPGSLLLVVGADTPANEAFAARVIEEPNALLSLAKIRALLQGRVAAEELEDKAAALLDATAAKRLAAGDSVVIPVEGLDPATRERYVRMAHAHRRPRHLILIETGKDRVARGGPRHAARPAQRARRRGARRRGLLHRPAPRRQHDPRAEEDRLRAAAVGQLTRRPGAGGPTRRRVGALRRHSPCESRPPEGRLQPGSG